MSNAPPLQAEPTSLRQLLDDWPYAREYLLETLDSALIERHAVMHLSRALNIGAAVAFMGAGVSMAYGRISWKNLVTELQRDALTALEELEPNEDRRKQQLPRLHTLYENLRNLKLDERSPGGDIRSDRYPSVFQLCAELSRGVEKERAGRLHTAIPTAGKDDAFDAGVKLRTRDGHFHSIHLLTQNLVPEALREDLLRLFAERIYFLGTSSRKDMFRMRDLTDWLTVGGKGQDNTAPGTDIPDILRDFLKKQLLAGSDATALPLKPSLRFLLTAALRHSGRDWGDHLNNTIAQYLDHGRFSRPADALRSSGTQDGTDVIETLRSKLKIRRFLTTNYDLEAERLILDLDFAPGQTLRGITRSADPLGRLARDFVVMRDAPATLVDFATREGGLMLDVAHLHGRALPGEHIVAAETQYQELYLRDDGNRDLLDQALSLAFRSNLLLFIGNGMGEDDILRPLRHFMSEGRGPTQPPAVALLPDLWGDEFVLEEKISLLRRYGVYTIHWGQGRLTKTAKPRPLLRDIKTLIAAIKSVLNTVETAEQDAAKAEQFAQKLEAAAPSVHTDDRQSRQGTSSSAAANRLAQRAAYLARQAREAAERLAKTTEADRRRRVETALAAWDKIAGPSSADALTIADPEHGRRLSKLFEVEGSCAEDSQAAPRIIWLEWQALDFIVRVAHRRTEKLREWLKDSGGQDGPAATVSHPPGTSHAVTLADRLCCDTDEEASARIVAAEIEDAVLSAFLAAKVEQLERAWRDWQVNWFPERFDVRPAVAAFGDAAPSSESTVLAPGFMIDRRHALVLADDETPLTDWRQRLPDRNFRASFSQTFAEFVDALRHTIGQPPSDTREREQWHAFFGNRRIHMLGGQRGLGKGHLFAALTNIRSFEEYASLVAATDKEGQRFFGLCGLNLSFSVEIGSAFERLCDFLFCCISNMYAQRPGHASLIPALQKDYRLFVASGSRTTGDRVGALRFLLGILAGPDPAPAGGSTFPRPIGRVALAINAAHLMFNARGYAKNAEIQRLVTALLDPAFQTAAIDIFLVGGETRLPAEIREQGLRESDKPEATLLPRNTASTPKPRLGDEKEPAALRAAALLPVNRSVFDEAADGATIEALRLRLGKVPTWLPQNPGKAAPASSPQQTAQDPAAPGASGAVQPGLFFHRVQQPRISVVMLTAFPRVALALARGQLKEPFASLSSTAQAELDASDQRSLQMLDQDAHEFFARHAALKERQPDALRITRDEVAEWLVGQLLPRRALDDTARKDLEREVDRAFGRLYKNLGRSRLCVSLVCAAADEAIARKAVLARPTTARGQPLAAGLEVLRRLSRALGGSDEANREDTVIRAVIDHHREQMDAGWLGDNHHTDERRLRSVIIREIWHAIPPEERPPTHRAKQKIKGTSTYKNFQKLVDETAALGRILFRLDEEVLTAVAMVGQPVEADCIAALQLHAFELLEQKVWEELAPAEQPSPEAVDRVRTRLTELSLDRLVRRCLVFRFAGRSSDEKGVERHRFAVHRMVQRHVFRRMHQPRVEFPEISNFMPTLYSDQPNDLPYPSVEAREPIRDMMVRLSLYPSRSRLGQSGRLPGIAPERAARMLRTRFDSYVPSIQPPPHGFIEEHRHMLRWLTRRAVRLGQALAVERDALIQAQRLAIFESSAANRIASARFEAGRIKMTRLKHVKRHPLARRQLVKRHQAAHHREAECRKMPPSGSLETGPAWERTLRGRTTASHEAYRRKLPLFIDDHVWLHNECGVLSLAQGRLVDAAKLFSVAERAVQRIESPGIAGAQTSIIRINRAVADIEMGKCAKADAALAAIAATSDESRSVRWIAHGYRGLVAHISGDAAAARRRYEEAVGALRAMARFRAASIFSRHLAALLRREGRRGDALEAAETAVTLASSGNHTDVYQLARITRVRVEIDAVTGGVAATMPSMIEVQKTLTNVADYARTMGMPRIAVEAAHLDAAIRLKVGDLHYANASVTEALSIATENGMTLKKVALTILAARIYLERGLVEDARLLAESARAIAIATQYAAVKDEAQQILVRCDTTGRRG